MKIAIATEDKHIDSLDDDTSLKNELYALLKNENDAVHIIDWRDSNIRLHSYDAIFVSSTWNAATNAEDFKKWIADCESDGVKRLINDREIIERCFDKKGYLQPLAIDFGMNDCKSGSVMPSIFIDTHDTRELDTILSNSCWDNKSDIVIKPRISADGDQTCIFSHNPSKKGRHCDNWENANSFLKSILSDIARKGAIIQPLILSVMDSALENAYANTKFGEYQLIFFGGKYSHAVGKPKVFKDSCEEDIQLIEKSDLPEEMYEFACKIIQSSALSARGKVQSRIRLDFFLGKNGPILAEAEVIEPNCNIWILRGSSNDVYRKALINFSNVIFERALELKNNRIYTERAMLAKIAILSGLSGIVSIILLSLSKKSSSTLEKITIGATMTFFSYFTLNNNLYEKGKSFFRSQIS